VNDLLIFITVFKENGFRMAAKQPDLSPSIVSESITTLEQNAGVPLSIRTTCSVTPTEAGRTLADLLPLC